MLPVHGHLGQVRENFARQFTPDDGFYRYRHGQRGAAYRLTVAEREAFVADFNRNIGRIYWLAFVAILAVLMLSGWWGDLLPPKLRPWSGALGLGVTVIVFIAIWWRLWTTPLRALERRTPVALPLDGAARWRINFGQLSWAPIVWGMVVSLLLLSIGVQSWRLSGSGLDYAIGGGIGVAFFGAIAAIKRRVRRS